MSEEMKKAIEQVGKELGAEMIVHNAVTVGAKKKINGETYGDYVVLITDAGEPDIIWKNSLNEFKAKMAKLFSEAK